MAWLENDERRGQEWAVRKLREQGRLKDVKAISPEMRKRIENAERRLARKEKKA